MAQVRITLRSHYYKVPYIVLEHYTPAFRNPEILREMITRAFNWVLEKYGLEVMLEPWDTVAENIEWVADSEFSYDIELHKHPEMGELCMGFEEALKERMLKMEAEKAKKEKKGKKRIIKSDNIEDYIRIPNKDAIISFFKEKTIDQHSPKDVAMPFRLFLEREMTYHIPYRAVVKCMPEFLGLIKENRYNEWTNRQRTSYMGYHKYKDLEKELEELLHSD